MKTGLYRHFKGSFYFVLGCAVIESPIKFYPEGFQILGRVFDSTNGAETLGKAFSLYFDPENNSLVATCSLDTASALDPVRKVVVYHSLTHGRILLRDFEQFFEEVPLDDESFVPRFSFVGVGGEVTP